MAPLEELHSRDLAWISDFVVQQVALTLRPMMEYLQQTDAAVDRAQRALQRLGAEVSEVRGDAERTSRSVAILRQGLGVQGESGCALQHGLEGALRSLRRLDDQAQGALGRLRGLEEGLAQQQAEARALGARQDDLARRLAAGAPAAAPAEPRARAERAAADARAAGSGLDGEARPEGCQRELRELQRGAPGAEPRPPRRPPHAPAEAAEPPPGRASRCSAPGAGSRPEALGAASPPRGSSRAAAWGGGDAEPDEASILAGDGPAAGSRLPTLAAKQPGASRPAADRGSAEAPRLRFTATLANPPSRGSPT